MLEGKKKKNEKFGRVGLGRKKIMREAKAGINVNTVQIKLSINTD